MRKYRKRPTPWSSVAAWTPYRRLLQTEAVAQGRIVRTSLPHYPSFQFFFTFILPLYPLSYLGLDPDISPDEQEEKARLISQVLELQNTLDGMENLSGVW